MKRLWSALPIGFVAAGGFVLAAPPILVDRVERASPEVIFAGPAGRNAVALTIDDGPADQTGAILDALAENGARATFFLIGGRVETRPDVVRRIVDAGHEIGNHTMQETASIRLAPAELERQLRETDALLSAYADPRWFRPGSGWYDGEMLDQAHRAGYEVVLASMWPVDAWLPWPPLVARYVDMHARPGAILVLHDGPGRGRRTADVLRRVLPELRRRGYEVTTVGGLLAGAEAPD